MEPGIFVKYAPEDPRSLSSRHCHHEVAGTVAMAQLVKVEAPMPPDLFIAPGPELEKVSLPAATPKMHFLFLLQLLENVCDRLTAHTLTVASALLPQASS